MCSAEGSMVHSCQRVPRFYLRSLRRGPVSQTDFSTHCRIPARNTKTCSLLPSCGRPLHVMTVARTFPAFPYHVALSGEAPSVELLPLSLPLSSLVHGMYYMLHVVGSSNEHDMVSEQCSTMHCAAASGWKCYRPWACIGKFGY